MVRTYTHLAAIDLLDHANAIRLPAISPTVPVSTDQEVEQNLNVISGVDEGIRTPNNRNHKANVGSGRNVIPLKINSLRGAPAGQRRRKTGLFLVLAQSSTFDDPGRAGLRWIEPVLLDTARPGSMDDVRLVARFVALAVRRNGDHLFDVTRLQRTMCHSFPPCFQRSSAFFFGGGSEGYHLVRARISKWLFWL